MQRIRLVATGLLVMAAVVWAAVAPAQTRKQLDPTGSNVSGLSPQKMVERARGYVDHLRSLMRSGFAMKEDARRNNDIPRLNCINDNLAAIRGLLKLCEQGLTKIQEASSRRDRDATEHEFLKVELAHSKAEEYDTLMKGCAITGPGPGIDARPGIRVFKDPDLPTIDPVGWMEALGEMMLPPSVASPCE